MNETRFLLSVRQRSYLLVMAILSLLLGITSPKPAFPLVLAVVFGFYFVFFGRFGTVVTPEGLRIQGFTSATVPWEQIEEIESRQVLGGHIAVLRLAGGGQKRLRAPVSAFLQRDANYDSKVEALRTVLAEHKAASDS